MTIPFIYTVPPADTIEGLSLSINCIIDGILQQDNKYRVIVLDCLFPLTSFDGLINAKATTIKIKDAATTFYNNQFANAHPLDLTQHDISKMIINGKNFIHNEN